MVFRTREVPRYCSRLSEEMMLKMMLLKDKAATDLAAAKWEHMVDTLPLYLASAGHTMGRSIEIKGSGGVRPPTESTRPLSLEHSEEITPRKMRSFGHRGQCPSPRRSSQ